MYHRWQRQIKVASISKRRHLGKMWFLTALCKVCFLQSLPFEESSFKSDPASQVSYFEESLKNLDKSNDLRAGSSRNISNHKTKKYQVINFLSSYRPSFKANWKSLATWVWLWSYKIFSFSRAKLSCEELLQIKMRYIDICLYTSLSELRRKLHIGKLREICF